MPKLDELWLDYPADVSELDLLRVALNGNTKSSVSDTSNKKFAIGTTKNDRWTSVITITLLVIVVTIIVSIEPFQPLLKKIKKGPLRLITTILIVGIISLLLGLILSSLIRS